MGATHSHGERNDHGQNLKIAFLLNLAFTIIEIVGGIWTNSIAILTDALHDAGDCASLGSAWYFEKISKRDRTEKLTYGYTRHRLLGAFITGATLIVGLGFVLWHAVDRLLSPEPVNAYGVMMLAVVGIVFNGIAVLRVRKGGSLTERVVSWHLLEDTLGWGAVLIGAGIMSIWDVPIIDPILSIGISIFVLWNVVRNLTEVTKIFLQYTPESFDLQQFEEKVKQLPRVLGAQHVHAWSLDGENHVISMRLQLMPEATCEEMVDAKRKVREILDDGGFRHVTIEVEVGHETHTVKR